MGDQAVKIIQYDVKKLLTELNKALADEWLAGYQYWVGARVVKGPFTSEVQKELQEHAEEEFKHADMLAERIIQLGGNPILNPNKWNSLSTCGFIEPSDFREIPILKQNLKGERCAIGVYNNLLEELKGKDHITFHLLLKILEEEIEHEEDLQTLLENIKMHK